MSFRPDAPSVTPPEQWASAVAARSLPPLDLGGSTARLVVVAAHPDDETLGASGLVARAHARGLSVDLVVATRGERSHPRSPTLTGDRLGAAREAELHAAAAELAPGARVSVLGLRDSAVAEGHDELVEQLVELVGDGRDVVLAAPWRRDGHPDHEAAGRATAAAAARTGARLLEYPVWLWHWGRPEDVPWDDATRLDLTDDERVRKAAAIACHRTQVEPLSSLPGDEVLLGPDLLAQFASPTEVFWASPPEDGALDDLHAEVADPWGVDRRWYERRKRALLLAMLPRERFASALEVGCSTGALAADLAARTERLVAVDASPAAVDRARDRLAGLPHVEVLQREVPAWWPDHRLDLVVLSEVAYFLSPAALDGVAARMRDTLAPTGIVVLCHWRHPVRGWPLDGPSAHHRLRDAGLAPVVAGYRDRDVDILVLADPARLPDPHG